MNFEVGDIVLDQRTDYKGGGVGKIYEIISKECKGTNNKPYQKIEYRVDWRDSEDEKETFDQFRSKYCDGGLFDKSDLRKIDDVHFTNKFQTGDAVITNEGGVCRVEKVCFNSNYPNIGIYQTRFKYSQQGYKYFEETELSFYIESLINRCKTELNKDQIMKMIEEKKFRENDLIQEGLKNLSLSEIEDLL